MKTIGVLGGLGPQTTMDFEARLHAVAQRLIPQLANRGYPPMIVYYLRCPPFVMGADFRPVLPLQPGPQLIEAARRLGPLVDTLLITANGLPAPQGKCRAGTLPPQRRKGLPGRAASLRHCGQLDCGSGRPTVADQQHPATVGRFVCRRAGA